MTDLDRVGGVPVVMKELLNAGLLHPHCLTVTGRTVRENLAGVPSVAELADKGKGKGQQAVLRPVSDPLSPPGRHMVVLTGNLAGESAVIKLSGKVRVCVVVCVCVGVGAWLGGLGCPCFGQSPLRLTFPHT
jgi:dihydroxy-acid dehydratase